MSDFSEKINKRKRVLRKILLNKLINLNKLRFQNKEDIVNNNVPRPKYISPADRSSYNYGFMNINEIGAGTPTIW